MSNFDRRARLFIRMGLQANFTHSRLHEWVNLFFYWQQKRSETFMRDMKKKKKWEQKTKDNFNRKSSMTCEKSQQLVD